MATQEAKQALILSADPSLIFIWTRCEVDIDVQYKLVENGVKTPASFANLASDEKDLRAALDSDFGLKSDTLQNRVKIGNLLSSWETVKLRTQKVQAILAENKAADLPRPVVASDFNSILMMVEKSWEGGKLPAALRPSKSYFASKLDELEDNDYSAEQLDMVTSRAVGDDSSMDLNESFVNGIRRFTKKVHKVPFPVDGEELRTRHKIMSVCLLCVKQKHAVPVLGDVEGNVFGKLSDYLLGEKVLRIQGDPSQWSHVLGYELAIRRKMAEVMRDEGKGLNAALEGCMLDQEVRGHFFTTPFLAFMAGAPRRWAPATPVSSISSFAAAVLPPPPPVPSGGDHGRFGIDKKGKGKGKGSH